MFYFRQFFRYINKFVISHDCASINLKLFNSTIVPCLIASSPLRSQLQARNHGNARQIIAF